MNPVGVVFEDGNSHAYVEMDTYRTLCMAELFEPTEVVDSKRPITCDLCIYCMEELKKLHNKYGSDIK